MPTIFRLFDLKIVMNNRGREHNPPHVHAYYNDDLAVIEINSGNLIQGYIPSSQLKIAKEFVQNNKEKLLNLWNEQPQDFTGFRNASTEDRRI